MTTRSCTCDQFDAALSDYVENALDPGQRAALESHAAACDRCRELLASLSAIAGRIAAPVVALPDAAARRAGRPPVRNSVRPWYLAPASLAAAAAVLVAATAGITTLAMRGGRQSAPSPVMAANDRTPAAESNESQLDIPAPAARNVSAAKPNAASVQQIYAREIAELDSIARDRRSHLDTATIAVIEKNLRIIDQAI